MIEWSLLILCTVLDICNIDEGIDSSFVNDEAITVVMKDFKHRILPAKIICRYGRDESLIQPNRVNFGRDKFTGYEFGDRSLRLK